MKAKKYKIILISALALIIGIIGFLTIKSISLYSEESKESENDDMLEAENSEPIDIASTANYEIETSQIDLFFPLEKEFKWEGLGKRNKTVIAKFLKNIPTSFDWWVEEYMPIESIEKYLYTMDINNDGLDDLIYSGYTLDPWVTFIFINKGEEFEMIFFDTSYIYKMAFEDERVTKIYTVEHCCCCEHIEKKKIYTFDYSLEFPKLILESQLLAICKRFHHVDKPDAYLDTPKKLEFRNMSYDIRLTTEVDDTSLYRIIDDKNTIGNRLGIIKSGTLFVLSEKIDSLGQTWWYVAICPTTEIYESLFYPLLELKYPYSYEESYKLGWILAENCDKN